MESSHGDNHTESFIINGLGGTKSLSGSVKIRGAKNAALKALAAGLLFKDEITLKNVPNIEDIHRMVDMLREIGVSVETPREGIFILHTPSSIETKLPNILAKRLRASIVLSGPILVRFGQVSFPHPGGCLIGARPIDIFLDGFQKFGAKLKQRGEWYDLKVPDDGLRGTELLLKSPSVTATETFMMTAIRAKGKTVIKNAALEPELHVLAEFLNRCGAKIEGAGTPTITIIGGKLLEAKGKVFKTPPDRIEAGSLFILGALAARNLEIQNCEPKHLESLIDLFKVAGVQFEIDMHTIVVKNTKSPRIFTARDIKTLGYPGFPTDLQAPMTVFLTQAAGEALVFETIFDGRLEYVSELVRMGAHINICDPHRVIVRGPTSLSGKELVSPDLRAGLAFVIAAIIAKGESVIHNVYNIDRGYERIEERLSKIGVDIKRVS